MEWWDRLKEIDPREVYHQLTSSGDGPSWLAVPRAVVRWSIVFYRQLERDRAFIRAGGMAYISLIALVPALLLVFGVLGATGLLERSYDDIRQFLSSTVLSQIPQVRDFLLTGLEGIDLAALGIVGVIGLLFVTSRLFLMIEKAYNDIFGVYLDRGLGRRMLNFYFTLTALPVAFAVALLATEDVLGGFTGGRLITNAMLFAVLLAALKMFPCANVRWRASIVGALVSTILLDLGGRLFPLYVRLFASDDPLRIMYGSLGLLPVFLVWLYLLWLFVLLGVEVAYVAQNFHSLAEAEFDQREARLLQAPSLPFAMEVAALIGAAFRDGTAPVETDPLAARLGAASRDVHAVVRVLERCGYVIQTERGWTIARPPEKVSLSELTKRWRELTSVRRETDDTVADAFYEALGPVLPETLGDLIDRWLEEPDYSPAVPALASEPPSTAAGGGSSSSA